MLRVVLVVLASVTLGAQAAAPTQPPQAPQGRDLVLVPNKPVAPRAGVPRGYAVIVGVAQYQNLDASKQLQFPESDAESMYRVLINREGGSFPAENVHFLKGSQATLANLRRELEEWLPSVAQPADRVVVYFAGHGFVQNGKGYLRLGTSTRTSWSRPPIP